MNRKTTSKCKNTDRKTAEKNRRNHMKSLCTELSSLIPQDYLQYHRVPIKKGITFTHLKTVAFSQENLTTGEQLEVAASYIKELNGVVEQLKEVQLQKEASTSTQNQMHPSTFPVVQLKESGSIIDSHITACMNERTLFYGAIKIFEDEGAEVLNASFSNNGDIVILTIHAQVKFPRIGVEMDTIYNRLMELVMG